MSNITEAMKNMQQAVEHHLGEIRTFFKEDHDVELSLLVRNKTIKDADVYFSNDEVEDVISAIRDRVK